MNYFDLGLILILIFFSIEGYFLGFLVMGFSVISFVFSIILSFSILKLIHVSNNFWYPLKFITTTIFIEFFLSILFSKFLKLSSKYFHQKLLNKLLGSLAGFLEGLVIIFTIIFLISAINILPKFKTRFLPPLYSVDIASYKFIPLNTKNLSLSENSTDEQKMLELINAERNKTGQPKLASDPRLQNLARSYAQTMWTEKYFSHIDKEGKNIGDRLLSAQINFQKAGENLALAPNVNTAHSALMASTDHRQNILSHNFSKVGISAIENSSYGIIFVQIFTN